LASRPPQRPAGGAPRGAAVLVLLSRLPRWAILVAVVVIVVAGLSVPGVAGAVLLAALAALLGWLLALAWPVLGPGARLYRIATIALVLGYAGYKSLH
jgi:hypothetical protein